jgi:ABC-type dipeptide/oligopeptide/nickel transport system permease component
VVVTILRNKTLYPKWFVLFVPALGSLVITAIGQSRVFPGAGDVLSLVVLSLPHLWFFTITTFYFGKKQVLSVYNTIKET